MKQTLVGTLYHQRWAFFFLLPALVLFFGFVLIPFLHAFGLGFFEFRMGSIRFQGLENYRRLLRDDIFWRSAWNTLRYVVILVPLEIGVALFVANSIYRRSARTIAVYRAIFYLPVVIPMVCMALVWRWMYNPSYGLIAGFLRLFGFPTVDLLGQPGTAIYALMAIILLYGVGQPLVLYIAALNGIPREIIEAAEIDGASPFAKFRRITLPLLRPTTLYNMVIQTIAVIQVIEVVILITGGGPTYTTSSLLFLVWNNAFQFGRLGYAAAIGNVMFVIVAVISALQFRFLASRVDY